MAQFGRPSTDTTNESYTDQAGGSTTIYTTLDETVASDADYIKSVAAPTSDVYVTKLTTLEDPVVHTGHTIRYRYAKDLAGGSQIDLTVELRQGYVSEVSQGTLIKQWSHTAISETWTQANQTLTEGEAATITDYTSLYLRFVSNQV
jgi:hypothetical protein